MWRVLPPFYRFNLERNEQLSPAGKRLQVIWLQSGAGGRKGGVNGLVLGLGNVM